jgi:hypothetical protein
MNVINTVAVLIMFVMAIVSVAIAIRFMLEWAKRKIENVLNKFGGE